MTTDVWSRMRARVDRARQRSADTPDANGGRACGDLEDLVKMRDQLEDEIDRAIIRARDQGAPWLSIPYGRSKQSAQQRHARAVERQRDLPKHPVGT